MVLIKEFRVVLPCSVQEYQVGQLYSVAEASKNETGGGEGIEVLKNEPYEKDGEKGQYTHKIYHLKSKVPAFVRMIAPEGSLVFHEKAWNAYPYCRTIVTNEYMKDDFFIKIETWHKPDLGTLENVHGLDPNTWKTVEIVHIDIADRSQVEPADYKADEDPALFQSVKTKRGPLGPNWKKELANDPDCSQMCAYKLVTIKFKWWGLQSKVENFIQKQEKRIFTNFHRQLFCWIDKWIDLTMEDIRRMEDETQKELETMRKKGSGQRQYQTVYVIKVKNSLICGTTTLGKKKKKSVLKSSLTTLEVTCGQPLLSGLGWTDFRTTLQAATALHVGMNHARVTIQCGTASSQDFSSINPWPFLRASHMKCCQKGEEEEKNCNNFSAGPRSRTANAKRIFSEVMRQVLLGASFCLGGKSSSEEMKRLAQDKCVSIFPVAFLMKTQPRLSFRLLISLPKVTFGMSMGPHSITVAKLELEIGNAGLLAKPLVLFYAALPRTPGGCGRRPGPPNLTLPALRSSFPSPQTHSRLCQPPGHGPPNTALGGPAAPQDVRGPRRAEPELRERS
ncbi:Phosphatidylinositol transfer protein beta isoform [Manis javanica]|nr:Phosphatidylinositol transfer protein beta isoform [Manis javanica]